MAYTHKRRYINCTFVERFTRSQPWPPASARPGPFPLPACGSGPPTGRSRAGIGGFAVLPDELLIRFLAGGPGPVLVRLVNELPAGEPTAPTLRGTRQPLADVPG